MLWTVFVVLSLLAVVFAAWPLWRKAHRLTPLVATVIVFTVASSAYLYNRIGSPDVPSGRSLEQNSLMDMDAAVDSLKARLASNPEDKDGWIMLGRTQMNMGDFAGAVETYEKVMELDEGKVAQTMVDLALALLNRDQQPIGGRTASLLETALELEPNNPSALFYAGFGAAERGDTDTAATRWERLLGLNPPENIRGILEQRIAEWRGEELPAMPPQHPPIDAATAAANAEVPADAVISARVTLSDAAIAAINGDANVFVIARDPAAPTPPIAVSRIRVSDLPTVVSLSDAQSMVAGRNLSAFSEIELLARVSLSGSPAAASGDWFGSMIVQPTESNSVFLTIDQQVP